VTIVAHITDLHVVLPGRRAYGVVDTAAYLEALVARLAAQTPRPDLIVATGDLVDGGKPEEYARLRALLAPLALPLRLIPGNHDDLVALRAAFPERDELRGETSHGSWSREVGGLHVIGLDTAQRGREGGYLDDERLAWLERALAAQTDRATLVLTHHPPFRTGIEHMDVLGFEGADAFAAVIEAHPQVALVASGHLHRPIVTRWAGTVALTVPSAAHQLALDLEPGAASAFVLEPAAFALHAFDGERIVTHYAAIEAAAGPYPFRDPSGALLAPSDRG
jgi:3',5'-cyclic AMP phosphodiesterase CpdA